MKYLHGKKGWPKRMNIQKNHSLEAHILVQGKVQGVGFRSTVVKHAMSCNVFGYVENVSNGDVKIVAQGSKEQIDQFVAQIKSQSGSACIDSIQLNFTTQQIHFKAFKMIHK